VSEQRPIHIWKTWISFGDTDPAKRIYFARIFEFGHRCLEDFALKKGLYPSWFGAQVEWGTPVRHAEADYFKPLLPGDEIEVRMFGHKLGKTSFTLRYDIFKKDELMATVKITHVTVNMKTGVTGGVVDSVKRLFQNPT